MDWELGDMCCPHSVTVSCVTLVGQLDLSLVLVTSFLELEGVN